MTFGYKMKMCLSFDDVLLVPQYSDVKSRHDIDLTAANWEGDPIEIGDRSIALPVFASPMDTVVDEKTAVLFSKNGVAPILHRYCEFDEQIQSFIDVMSQTGPDDAPIGAALGTSDMCLNHAVDLYNAGCRLFCVDVAHGHHELSLFVVKTLRHMFDDVFIIAGNVATLDGFEALADAGADAVRVGIGGGAVCSTRVVTGHGIPTLQSVADCSGSDRTCYIIADGGIKNTGDIVKSFAAGADFVMLGSMLAGKKESPGETKTVEGVVYKNYRGMASASAQMDWRGRVSVAEGVDSWRPVSESIEETVDLIAAGVRSGLSYSGCESLDEFHGVAEFVRITPASMKESVPHAVGVIF